MYRLPQSTVVRNRASKSINRKNTLLKHKCYSSRVPVSNYDSETLNYGKLIANIDLVKDKLGRNDLTYAEKILYGHLMEPTRQDAIPGVSYLKILPGTPFLVHVKDSCTHRSPCNARCKCSNGDIAIHAVQSSQDIDPKHSTLRSSYSSGKQRRIRFKQSSERQRRSI